MIVNFAEAHPEDQQVINAAQALFLNGKPDRAIQLLLKHKVYLAASNYLTPRLMLKEAATLPDIAADSNPRLMLRLRATQSIAERFIGHAAKARSILAEVAQQATKLNDSGLWEAASRAARENSDAVTARAYLAEALASAQPSDDIVDMFRRAGVASAELPARWWACLHQLQGARDLAPAALRVIDLVTHRPNPAPTAVLAEEIRRYAVTIPPPGRFALLALAADTFVAAGRLEEAEATCSAAADEAPNIRLLTSLGEIRLKRSEWDSAASSFQRAWEMDHAEAAPLFLLGLALDRGGQSSEGKRLMELAHRIPLANEVERHALLEACLRHHCREDVRRERELILRTGEFGSWERSDALRGLGDDAAGIEDYGAAAAFWDRAFWTTSAPAGRSSSLGPT